MCDYGWYLCLVIYGVLVGNKEFIEIIGLIGVKEMYNFLNVLVLGMVDVVIVLKDVVLGLLSVEDVNEIVFYFDYII